MKEGAAPQYVALARTLCWCCQCCRYWCGGNSGAAVVAAVFVEILKGLSTIFHHDIQSVNKSDQANSIIFYASLYAV